MRIVSNKYICRKCRRFLRLIVHTRYTMYKEYEQQYVTNDLAHPELSIHNPPLIVEIEDRHQVD